MNPVFSYSYALKQHFPHFFSFYEDNPHLHRFLEPFVLHMSELTELKTETVTDLIEHTLSPKIKNQVMTTYAQFKMEGKMEGILQGKTEGILQGKTEGILQGKIEMLYKSWRKGFSIDIIADLTDLPETTIQLWMGRFETLRKARLDSLTVVEIAPIVHLTEQQVTDWWAFMDKAVQKDKKA